MFSKPAEKVKKTQDIFCCTFDINEMMMDVQGAAIKKTALHKVHYCRSGSELSCEIFRHCSLSSFPSVMLGVLCLLQYF